MPVLFYYTEDPDLCSWSIDRYARRNATGTYWYEFQVRYEGESIGRLHLKLRDAKKYVEREAR